MPARHFYIPLDLRSPGSPLQYFVADLEFDALIASGSFTRVRYVRFDTGGNFTSIPFTYAENLGIPFSHGPANEVRLIGTTGTGVGYLNDLNFRFPAIPGVQFHTKCIISRTLPRPILCLTDVVRNFHLSTRYPQNPPRIIDKQHPYGAFVLRLREDHQGQPVK